MLLFCRSIQNESTDQSELIFPYECRRPLKAFFFFTEYIPKIFLPNNKSYSLYYLGKYFVPTHFKDFLYIY